MTAQELIRTATRLLNRNGPGETTAQQRDEANAHSYAAIALALTDLANTAKADQAIPADPAPPGVTARILTAYGRRYNDHRTTVDVHDDGSADCLACGWTHRPTAYVDQALDAAAGHANTCMALPQPAVNTAIHHSA